MSTEPAIIYAARTLRDAYALRDRLAQSGIVAVVLTDASGIDAGRGADGPVAARVVVAPSDADSARHIAQVFDRRSAERPTGLPAAGSQAATIPDWPNCPECGTLRIARCPICETTGTHFTEADREFLDPGDFAAEAAAGRPVAATAPTCGCGSAACSATHSSQSSERYPTGPTERDAAAAEANVEPRDTDEPRTTDGSRPPDEHTTAAEPGLADQAVRDGEPAAGAAPRAAGDGDGHRTRGAGDHGARASLESQIPGQTASAAEPLPLVLICPICDEPFVPRFARRCAWCAHLFPDGFDYERETAGEQSEVDRRVVLMIAGLVGLLLFLLAYFRYLI